MDNEVKNDDTQHKPPPGFEHAVDQFAGPVCFGSNRWTAEGRGYIASGDTKQECIDNAWLHFGMTRAEYEQRERAVEFVRRIAGGNIEREVGPLSSLAVKWHDEADDIIAALTEAEADTAEAKPDTSDWLDCPGCGDSLHEPVQVVEKGALFEETEPVECKCGVWSHISTDDFDPENPRADVVLDDHLPEADTSKNDNPTADAYPTFEAKQREVYESLRHEWVKCEGLLGQVCRCGGRWKYGDPPNHDHACSLSLPPDATEEFRRGLQLQHIALMTQFDDEDDEDADTAENGGE